MWQKVILYFEGVKSVISSEFKSEYRVGIYGSRNICRRVSDKGLAETSFVSDMSTGYSGNFGYAMPKNWAFDQFNEYTFSGFGLDKDAVSGRDNGVTISTVNVYDRKKAIVYADKWYNGRNPDY